MVITMEPSSVTWQGFLIINLGGLLALSFFLGKLTNRVDNLEKTQRLDKFAEDMQRLRSAYHQMAGFMQLHHRDWEPYDLDREK